MDQQISWIEPEASAETIVRAFLVTETDPNSPLFGFGSEVRTAQDADEIRALRRLLKVKFEDVVVSWAAANHIPASAFLRLGIQPTHLTGICADRCNR